MRKQSSSLKFKNYISIMSKSSTVAPTVASTEAHTVDYHNDLCQICSFGGELICCDYCNLVYHMKCLPRNEIIPDEPLKWSCPACIVAKDISIIGVQSPSPPPATTTTSSNSETTTTSKRSSSNKTKKKRKNEKDSQPSAYEVARKERIAENKRTIAKLSLQPEYIPQIQVRKQLSVSKKRKPRTRPARSPQIAVRISKRLRGIKSSPSEPKNEEEYEALMIKRKKQKEEQEQSIYEEIFARWNNSSSTTTTNDETTATRNNQTLFLVPTGVEGVNDHTLSTPVCDNHYLWGKLCCSNITATLCYTGFIEYSNITFITVFSPFSLRLLRWFIFTYF